MAAAIHKTAELSATLSTGSDAVNYFRRIDLLGGGSAALALDPLGLFGKALY